MTVATVAWTTDQVLRRLIPEATPAEWTDPTAKVCLVDRTLDDGWAGHPIPELEEAIGARVVAINRMGAATIPTARTVAQAGDVAVRRRRGRPAGRRRRRPALAAAEGALTMRVVIAGGGSVGRFIAEQLHGAGHDVTIIDNDPRIVGQARRSGEPAGVTWHEGDACELSTLERGERRHGRGRRRGHRRRRGQPRHLAARQAGVRRAPGRRPGEQPEERVDVQRPLGRRRLGVDAPPHHRAGRGGGERRHVRPPALVRGRQGAAGRGAPRRRAHRPTARRSSTSACHATPRSSPCCATRR